MSPVAACGFCKVDELLESQEQDWQSWRQRERPLGIAAVKHWRVCSLGYSLEPGAVLKSGSPSTYVCHTRIKERKSCWEDLAFPQCNNFPVLRRSSALLLYKYRRIVNLLPYIIEFAVDS